MVNQLPPGRSGSFVARCNIFHGDPRPTTALVKACHTSEGCAGHDRHWLIDVQSIVEPAGQWQWESSGGVPDPTAPPGGLEPLYVCPVRFLATRFPEHDGAEVWSGRRGASQIVAG